jgi:arylsulfate sulfotransferase
MNNRKLAWVGLWACTCSNLISLGCGSGSGVAGNPVTAIANTQNPLIAQYQVTEFGPANVWVEFGLATTYGKKTSVVSAAGPLTNTTSVVVAGMKPSTSYHMRIHVEYTSGKSWIDQDQVFKTGPLPSSNRLGVTVTRPNPGLGIKQSGVELLDVVATGTNNLQGLVTDLDGNVIWYYDFGPGTPSTWPFPIKQLDNGDMLMMINSTLTDNLVEIDLTGRPVRNITLNELNEKLEAAGIPQVANLHHDVLVLPNGHWVVLGQYSLTLDNLQGYTGPTQVTGDELIDLDTDLNIVWHWSTFDHLDVNRHLQGLPDWTHSNAVVYTPNDGNILLSMRNQSWVIKIDYANGTGQGDILWTLGQEGDIAIAGGDPSNWFYAQHYPYVISADSSGLKLAVFDDGNQRLDMNGVPCKGIVYPDCYSRATIFQVDEATKLATLDWEYKPGYFTFWGGSIVTLPNGDVDFDASAPVGLGVLESRVLEVTQTSDPQVVWQMEITGGNAYRAYRIPSLYPGVVWNAP